jgi:hypothetical protein
VGLKIEAAAQKILQDLIPLASSSSLSIRGDDLSKITPFDLFF